MLDAPPPPQKKAAAPAKAKAKAAVRPRAFHHGWPAPPLTHTHTPCGLPVLYRPSQQARRQLQARRSEAATCPSSPARLSAHFKGRRDLPAPDSALLPAMGSSAAMDHTRTRTQFLAGSPTFSSSDRTARHAPQGRPNHPSPRSTTHHHSVPSPCVLCARVLTPPLCHSHPKAQSASRASHC